jgi:hypothetical protein
MPNPFRKITDEEKLARETNKKIIEQKIKFLSELGSYMLSSPQGEHYREELMKQRDQIIKLAIVTVDPDPIKDAFFCRAIFNKLGVLYGLLEEIEKDAKRQTA